MRHIVIAGFADYRNLTWAEWRAAQPGPVEVWSVNNPAPWIVTQHVPVDIFFQIHERWSLSEAEEEWVTRCPVPMYTCYPWPEVEDRRDYPLEAVLAMPGVLPGGWLTCSFCYALGLVCWEAYHDPQATPTRITLYGVELQAGSTRERLVEHAGVLWWSGFAAGLGITVDAPPPSRVLAYPHLYGHDYHAEGDFARGRVKDFLLEARNERRDGTWVAYDSGMRARERASFSTPEEG